MAGKKIIAVVGATGKQGGSVVDTFLGLSGWHVRGMTRNPSSEAAQALKAKGAEVVKGDLAEPESLSAAFTNATAIFLNTDFWGAYNPAKAALEAEGKDVAAASQVGFDYETTCGKNAAVAAAAVPTLERFIISSLPSVAQEGIENRSLHPEAKAWIVKYVETEQPALAKKTSVLYLGMYNSNPMLMPRHDKDTDTYKFNSPVRASIHLPLVDAVKSTGLFVRELIENEAPGVKLLAYDDYLTVEEVVQKWSEVIGKKVEISLVSIQVLHDYMHMPWERLDVVDQLDKTDAYETGLPEYIRPSQLKVKVDTKPFEVWAKENSTF